MYVLLIWIDDNEVTRFNDWDEALREFEARPHDLSEAIERHDTGAKTYTVRAVEQLLSEAERDARDERRHDTSLAAKG